MHTLERIKAEDGAYYDLRITRHKGGRKQPPSMKVVCEHSPGKAGLVIHYADKREKEQGITPVLEIGGVLGTVGQWRQVFGPLLGFDPKECK